MNELAVKQIHEDYMQVLSTDAGKRVLGGIFHRGRLNGVGLCTDYSQGMRDLAVKIANTVHEASPYGVIESMKAYEDFLKEHSEDERRDDTEPFTHDYSDE